MEPTSVRHDDALTVIPEKAASERAETTKVESLIDVDIEPPTTLEPIETLTPTRMQTASTNITGSVGATEPITEPAHDNIDEACDRADSIASDSTLLPDTEPANVLEDADAQEELRRLRAEKQRLDQMVTQMKEKLDSNKVEFEREVCRRVDLEQRFTEEAKRTTDQIEELIAKSDSDDTKLAELKKKFDLYTRETSSMIENFTTNREFLASQLIELRNENDYLLGKYISKARELQNADIDLPQNVEELQFHCLTLNEKLILTTLAKERLEETLVQTSISTSRPPIASTTSQT